MTEEEFTRCLPSQFKGSVSDEVRTLLNDVMADKDTRDAVCENLIGFTNVLSQGKFKLDAYINAVKYVSYKAMGDTNKTAYSKTFPAKITDFKQRGMLEKDINSLITAYNKSKLVTLLYEQTMIPTYILNQDVFQEAINTQREIMLNTSYSAMARTAAARSLMDILKPPETKKMELDVNINGTSDILADLRKTTEDLAKAQIESLNNGKSIVDILNAPIIEDAEYAEV